jgi:hypothetical protein
MPDGEVMVRVGPLAHGVLRGDQAEAQDLRADEFAAGDRPDLPAAMVHRDPAAAVTVRMDPVAAPASAMLL